MPVYLASRDLSGVMFVGTHLFIIIVPSGTEHQPAMAHCNNYQAMRDLGDGTQGFVIGAQKRKRDGQNRLIVEFFEEGDFRATKEYFNPDKYISKWKKDYDTEVSKLSCRDGNEARYIQTLFRYIFNYIINEEEEHIHYPTAGFGTNSNSWAQTVVRLAGGDTVVGAKEDFEGADIFSGHRIPEEYFMPICPVKRRPLVNKKK